MHFMNAYVYTFNQPSLQHTKQANVLETQKQKPKKKEKPERKINKASVFRIPYSVFGILRFSEEKKNE